MSLFAPILVAVFVLAIQGLLLQTACALTGEKPPSYGEAALTALVAGVVAALGTLAWGCTFGLVVALFSRTLAWALGVATGLAITASVYRVRLGVSGGQAFAIGLLHHVMAWAVSGLLYTLIRHWPF